MQINILRHSTGIMDGVSLSHLLPGVTYEVPVSLGMWLISQRHAEQDVTPTVGAVIPIDMTFAMFSGGVSVSPGKDHDDDRLPRRSRKKR